MGPNSGRNSQAQTSVSSHGGGTYPYVRPAYHYYAGPGPYWGGYPYGPYRPAPFPFFPLLW
jgi:hypothetical protein